MIRILVRRIAGTAMGLLSLFCVLVLLIGILGEHNRPPRIHTQLSVEIVVDFVFAAVAALTGWVSFTLFRKPPFPRSGSKFAGWQKRKVGRWQLAEGETFKRPWYIVPASVFAMLMTAIIGPLGALATFAGLRTLFTKSIINGLEMTGFGLLVFCPCAVSFFVFLKAIRWGWAPLAIVGQQGITMPGSQPEYLDWNNVASIRTFRVGKGVFLELTPVDCSKVYPRRRGWWHGPWRDSVTIRIENTRDPLVQATLQTHAAWQNRISAE